MLGAVQVQEAASVSVQAPPEDRETVGQEVRLKTARQEEGEEEVSDGDYVVVYSAPCKNCSADHGVYTYGCRPIIFDAGVQGFSNRRAPTDDERQRGISWKEVQRAHA